MSGHATDTGTRPLERSRSDRMLAGVAGGLGAWFELHSAVFRVAFVVLTLMGGAGILIYLAAALVMPDEGAEDSVAMAALRRRRPWVVVVLGVLAVVPLAVLSELPVWAAGDAWPFLLVAGAVLLGLTWYGVAGGSRPLRRLAVAVAALVVVLLAAVAAFLAVFDVHLGEGLAARAFAPASVDDLRDEYRLGMGELVLDLRSVDFPVGETRLGVRVDAGSIHVLVPDGVALRASADARLGDIRLLGARVEGWGVDEVVDERGVRVLVLDAVVGIGEIRVERGVR
ncbi:MAG TPA: PspC domain-containing protein [Gaiellaceae bacterium]|nr:PspC domain-containing protein [Gaiellaceae bacterium]